MVPGPGGHLHPSAQGPFPPSSPKPARRPSRGPRPGEVLAPPGCLRFNWAARMMPDDAGRGPQPWPRLQSPSVTRGGTPALPQTPRVRSLCGAPVFVRWKQQQPCATDERTEVLDTFVPRSLPEKGRGGNVTCSCSWASAPCGVRVRACTCVCERERLRAAGQRAPRRNPELLNLSLNWDF